MALKQFYAGSLMKPIKLKEHQLVPIEYMRTHRALLLYHSTGSGKTIIALKAMSQFSNEIIIIGTKSGKKAFEDDIKKLGLLLVTTKLDISL